MHRAGSTTAAMPRPLTASHVPHMVLHMKTTLNIDDSVMQRLREQAARQGKTMSEIVEAGLRLVLENAETGRRESEPAGADALPAWDSGGAKVDIANREALYTSMGSD